MVRGLDLFRERFRDFAAAYVIIGGTACSMAMENYYGLIGIRRSVIGTPEEGWVGREEG